MAMIKCPECGTEVSDKAEKCPKCAYPISGKSGAEKVQTIEQTSKKYKKQLIFAVLVSIIGAMIIALNGGSGGVLLGGLLTTIGGLVWFIIVKIKIWWHHK